MKAQTIQQLNEMNKVFYQTVGSDFDSTRQQPWEGWRRVAEIIHNNFKDKSEISILDIGCGNGRFGEYLNRQIKSKTLNYVGIDSDQFLLDQAKEKEIPTSQFIQADIIADDLASMLTKKFDVIVLFGIIHHLPSYDIRAKLLLQLTKALNPSGLFVFTCWQFDTHKNLLIRSTELIAQTQLDPKHLEENDFLLDWKRGETAIRYCHLTDETEIEKLIQPLKLTHVDQFKADGKNHQSNIYVILQS